MSSGPVDEGWSSIRTLRRCRLPGPALASRRRLGRRAWRTAKPSRAGPNPTVNRTRRYMLSSSVTDSSARRLPCTLGLGPWRPTSARQAKRPFPVLSSCPPLLRPMPLCRCSSGCSAVARRALASLNRHALPAHRARSRVQASASAWAARDVGGPHSLRCDVSGWCLQCPRTLARTRRNARPLHPRVARKSAGRFSIHAPALRGYDASPNLTVNRTRRFML